MVLMESVHHFIQHFLFKNKFLRSHRFLLNVPQLERQTILIGLADKASVPDDFFLSGGQSEQRVRDDAAHIAGKPHRATETIHPTPPYLNLLSRTLSRRGKVF